MKKIISFLVSGILVIGTVSCENASKTSSDAPDTTNENTEAPDAQTAQQTQSDATSEVRKAQIESDIRAREGRNDVGGDDAQRADADLKSEVRGKLEANIPASQLVVDAEEGAVTVTGTVSTQEQLSKIDPLAKEIKGVKSVINNVTIAPVKAQ